jgi:8-oxo-dGTP pyrophosphatase MutT (NUDIX family)
MSIHRRSSRTVYTNAWMRVREDEIEHEDGSQGLYGVVEKPDFALVIPLDVDDSFWLVEQYRYPVQRRFWEFPQGSWEGRADVDAAELARGELREETGLTAGALAHLGHLYGAYGFCAQGFDVWLATDLQPGPSRRENGEQDMRTQRVSRTSWEAMVRSGEVKDGASIAAYGLLLLRE